MEAVCEYQIEDGTKHLVGLAMLLGREVLEAALMVDASAALAVVSAIAVGYGLLRLGLALASLRGRRLLAARLRGQAEVTLAVVLLEAHAFPA